jgi:transposase
MRPYSLGFRQRVAAAVDPGDGSRRRIARRFRVRLAFVARRLHRRRQTGTLDPQPHGGGHPPALDHDGRERLRDLVRQQPEATLDEWRRRVGTPRSRMPLWRALRTLKLTRKTKMLQAQERDTPENPRQRQAFRKQVAAFDPRRLVFVDETGTTTVQSPDPAYSNDCGFHSCCTVCPTQAWIALALTGPITLVLDNARDQRNAVVQALATELGISLLFPPSYSPNLNLIERLWKLTKRRALYGRYHPTCRDFQAAIPEVLDGLSTNYSEQLASLMTLNVPLCDDVSLMAA